MTVLYLVIMMRLIAINTIIYIVYISEIELQINLWQKVPIVGTVRVATYKHHGAI